MKTLMQIKEEVEAFVNKRDQVVFKGSKSSEVYRAIHLKSSLGDFPACHCRPRVPKLVSGESEVDCRYCLIIIRDN